MCSPTAPPRATWRPGARRKLWKRRSTASGQTSQSRTKNATTSPTAREVSWRASSGGGVAAPPRGATWIFRGGRSRTSRRHAQVAKLRQLSFNLKKNQELRQDVVSGDVGAARLMAMDADELATSAVREERKKMAESLRRVDISQTGRGDAAAASWIFRGDVPSPVPRGSS